MVVDVTLLTMEQGGISVAAVGAYGDGYRLLLIEVLDLA